MSPLGGVIGGVSGQAGLPGVAGTAGVSGQAGLPGVAGTAEKNGLAVAVISQRTVGALVIGCGSHERTALVGCAALTAPTLSSLGIGIRRAVSDDCGAPHH